MTPRGRGKIRNLSLLETWPLWFVPLLCLTVPLSQHLGSKISSAYDEMLESFGRNEALERGFCFQAASSTFVCDAPKSKISTAPLGHFGISVSVTDRPPTRFSEGYHGPALPLSFRWRTTSPSSRTPRFFPFCRLPTVWPSVWSSVFSAGPGFGNMTRFWGYGTAWTTQPIRRSGTWTESSTLQCPAPDTHAHFLVGAIRTRDQCSLDNAPRPKAPEKPNPTRGLQVKLDFLCLYDAPPRVGGCASKRLKKKQKKFSWRLFTQVFTHTFSFFSSCCLFKKSAKDKTKAPKTEYPQYKSPLLLLRIALAECIVWCFVDDMLLADVLRFGVFMSMTTAPSVYDRVFTTAPSAHGTENPQYESPRDILLLPIALVECFVLCFVDCMLLADVLRFGVIFLVTTLPWVYDRGKKNPQDKTKAPETENPLFDQCGHIQQQVASAAASPVGMGLVDSARSVAEAEQVVFFMMSFCLFTVYD